MTAVGRGSACPCGGALPGQSVNDQKLTRMYVIFVLAIIIIACLFFLLDRALKAIQRGRRRRDASERLVAAAIAAEEQHRRQEQQRRQQKAQHEASTALTNVLPAIRTEDDGPRKVA